MFISKKRYKHEIEEEVNKALSKVQEERWMSDRIEDIRRESCRMYEEIDRRVRTLEDMSNTEKKGEKVNCKAGFFR